MLKKYIVSLLLINCLVHLSQAQDKSTKIRLQSITSIGLLNGSNGSSMALQTILGGAYKNVFAGIGAGLDYYRFRTVPVFADVRYEFGHGTRNVFLYGDIGYNIDWVTEKNKAQSNVFSFNNNYNGGVYYDAGIGYKIGLNNADAFVISTGFSFKKLENKIVSMNVCPLAGPCIEDNQTYRYYLSRLVIKAGWRF